MPDQNNAQFNHIHPHVPNNINNMDQNRIIQPDGQNLNADQYNDNRDQNPDWRIVIAMIIPTNKSRRKKSSSRAAIQYR